MRASRWALRPTSPGSTVREMVTGELYLRRYRHHHTECTLRKRTVRFSGVRLRSRYRWTLLYTAARVRAVRDPIEDSVLTDVLSTVIVDPRCRYDGAVR